MNLRVYLTINFELSNEKDLEIEDGLHCLHGCTALAWQGKNVWRKLYREREQLTSPSCIYWYENIYNWAWKHTHVNPNDVELAQTPPSPHPTSWRTQYCSTAHDCFKSISWIRYHLEANQNAKWWVLTPICSTFMVSAHTHLFYI